MFTTLHAEIGVKQTHTYARSLKQKGYVHIHDYGRDANGNPCRKTPGRDLSPAEMAKYGKLIERMKGSLK